MFNYQMPEGDQEVSFEEMKEALEEMKEALELIEKNNPKWIDLFEATYFKMPGPRLSSG